MKNQFFSKLPKVDEVLEKERIQALLNGTPRPVVIEEIRRAVSGLRQYIKEADEASLEKFTFCEESFLSDIENGVKQRQMYKLKKVINATGVVLHTNLGRSPLPLEAREQIASVACSYSNLEFDIEAGIRGSRYSHVEELICSLTGAEAAMVVNNNAAAVTLALSSLCQKKEAVVSRGELVEIGGAFRIPEVMKWAGATLIEVGTTNKTHIGDYNQAISEETGLLMKVHTSNYKIMGFTESVSVESLSELAKKKNLPLYEDIGSGSLIDLSAFGFSKEPTVQESIKAGADVVSFSGDKMLGGPQAGILVGKKKYIDKMKENHLTRALRIDKMTLAALEVVLRYYREEKEALCKLPTLNMLTTPYTDVKKRCEKLLKQIDEKTSSYQPSIVDGYGEVGGGSMPMEKIPTCLVSLNPMEFSCENLSRELRFQETPIIARVESDRVLLDARTLQPGEGELIVKALMDIEEKNL